MKRNPVSLTNALGRTIEGTLNGSSDCLILLLSGDAYLQIQSGCYDEDDHYLEVDYDAGITLVKYGRVNLKDALEARLITQDEIDQFEAEKRSKADKDRADRLAMYERLKQEFGE
jgi:hypothetical protein